MQVLLVDDDPAIVRLLEVNFRLAGFEVRSVSGGADALSQAETDPPDAIVLDVMMPGLDGLEVCRRLRQLPAHAGTPVVFLTARGATADHGLPGPIEVVPKPFDPAHVVDVVRTQLRAAS